ncbi:uncharacterized protein LOC126837117 [Adelges cooleyi]|uniref:uncharacterized protein LOC126837117 n=1 Tax=Adelges cooleyi TaxID=133065 RepID=UPI0021804F8E|nr:uncharacterized protein LOC126837117 [Adelges cooleyi]
MNAELIVIAMIALFQNALVYAEDTKQPITQPLVVCKLYDSLKGVCTFSLSDFGATHPEWGQFKLAANNYTVKLFLYGQSPDDNRYAAATNALNYLKETVNKYGETLSTAQIQDFKKQIVEIQEKKNKQHTEDCKKLNQDNLVC